MKQKNKQISNNIMKKMMPIMIICCLLLTSVGMTGCIESTATESQVKTDKTLITNDDGTLGINPSIWGDNIDYDGTHVNSVDTTGGGDGYRSDSSIQNVVEAMTHTQIDMLGGSKIRDPTGTSPGYWSGGCQYIMNENTGETYVATGANLIIACDAASNGDVIKVPIGVCILNNDLNLYGVKLIGYDLSDTGQTTPNNNSSVINLRSSYTINMYQGSSMSNLHIQCNSTHGGEAIHIWGNSIFWGKNNVLNYVSVYKSQNTNGTGVNISGVSTDANVNTVSLCDFNNINIMGFNISMILYSDEGGAGNGYINGNNFNNVLLSEMYIGLKLISGSGQIHGNVFTNLQIEPATETKYGIILDGDDTDSNQFIGFSIWDVSVGAFQYIYAINISDTNCDENVFIGFLSAGTLSSHVYNAGQDNVLIIDGQFRTERDFILGDAALVDTTYEGLGITDDNSVSEIQQVSYRDNAFGMIQNKYYSSRGSESSPANVQSGDDLMKEIFYGRNASDFTEYGRIFWEANNTASGDYVGGKYTLRIKDQSDGGNEDIYYYADNSQTGGANLSISGTIYNDGDIHCNGKLTADGGVDPPYISFSLETHESIREYANNVKSDQVIMEFWNAEPLQKEYYNTVTDCFYVFNTNELIDE